MRASTSIANARPSTVAVIGPTRTSTFVPPGKKKTFTSSTLIAIGNIISVVAVTGKADKGVLQVSIKDGFTPPLPGSPPAPAKIVEVSVPANAPVGALNDDVIVHTNVPGEERIVIQVRGRIYKRTGD